MTTRRGHLRNRDRCHIITPPDVVRRARERSPSLLSSPALSPSLVRPLILTFNLIAPAELETGCRVVHSREVIRIFFYASRVKCYSRGTHQKCTPPRGNPIGRTFDTCDSRATGGEGGGRVREARGRLRKRILIMHADPGTRNGIPSNDINIMSHIPHPRDTREPIYIPMQNRARDSLRSRAVSAILARYPVCNMVSSSFF